MEKATVLRKEQYRYPSENHSRLMYIVVCPECGTEKRFRPSELPNKKWVCIECVRKSQRAAVSCNNCGMTIIRPLSKLLNSKNGLYFCDRKCKEEQQKIGGILELPHYGSDNNYRKKAFDKYGNKCNDCEITDDYLLVVHHIDKDRSNNIIENLEILCHNHHADRHKKFSDGKWILDYK